MAKQAPKFRATLETAIAIRTAAVQAWENEAAKVVSVLRDEWMEQGGCIACDGAGWHVQHYHDGDSMHDPCERCNPGGKKIPNCYSCKTAPTCHDPRAVDMLSDLRAKADAASDMLRTVEECYEIGKGSPVHVWKGRKVPVGTIGVVKWIGSDGFGGTRVGLAVEGKAGLVYTALENVEAYVAESDPWALASGVVRAA